MCGEGVERPPCSRVPEVQDAAYPRSGRQAPVVAERHGNRMEPVWGEFVRELRVPPVPDCYGPFACCREMSAVGTERRSVRRPEFAADIARLGKQLLLGRQVPDLHLPDLRRP